MTGFVAIHRQIKDNFLWKDKPFSKGQAWIDILLRVNHKPNEVLIGNQVVGIEKGQTIWSILDMSKEWGWSRKKVENFLNVLEKEQMLYNKRTTKYTMLTVAKWDSYQYDEQQKNNKRASSEQQKSIKRASKEHQKSTNNNDNNKDNENNEDNENKNTTVLTPLEKTIEDFKKHRKAIKSPMTDRAVELMIMKLNKIAFSDNEKIEILNNSIENGWKGIFELTKKSDFKGNADTDNVFVQIGRERGIL